MKSKPKNKTKNKSHTVTTDYFPMNLDEQQMLNSSAIAFRMPSRPRKTQGNTCLRTISKHCINHYTAYCIILTLAIVSLAMISIQMSYVKKTDVQAPVHQSSERVADHKEKEGSGLVKNGLSDMGKAQLRESSQLKEKEEKRVKKTLSQSANKIDANNYGQIIFKNDPSTSNPAPKPVPTSKARPAARVVAQISGQQRTKASTWAKLKDQDIYTSTPTADEQRQYYQQKYNISQYPQLPFCIVVPSYNNKDKQRHLTNIFSILMQEYSNYHIVFIDDASTDGTGDEIEEFLEGNQTKITKDRYIVVRNKEQKRAMPNLRMAAKQHCQPEDIFLIVDGDDQLLGRQVLKLFNSVFQKDKAWFVYSNFMTIKGGVGYSRPFPVKTMQANSYRKYPFVTSHLRAFYTKLFLMIKEEDLQDKEGNYLKAANDVAICIPILEMSHKRVKYIPELTYLYNSNTGQNNHKLRLKEQKSNNKMLRFRNKYEAIEELFPDAQATAEGKEEQGEKQFNNRLLTAL